jgi:hypothetical protein
VERKESMEKFLEGVVATMDFLIYKPLFYFLNSNDELRPLIKKIERIQAVIRMFLIQRKMNKVDTTPALLIFPHFLFRSLW